MHAEPLLPQLPLAVPATQLVPSQHPPLHESPPAHDVVQTWFEQALFAAQSLVGSLQPQAPLTQAVPWAEPVQSTHWPGLPQLVGDPLHGAAASMTPLLLPPLLEPLLLPPLLEAPLLEPPLLDAPLLEAPLLLPPLLLAPLLDPLLPLVASKPESPPDDEDPLEPDEPLLFASFPASTLASPESCSSPTLESPHPAAMMTAAITPKR